MATMTAMTTNQVRAREAPGGRPDYTITTTTTTTTSTFTSTIITTTTRSISCTTIIIITTTIATTEDDLAAHFVAEIRRDIETLALYGIRRGVLLLLLVLLVAGKVPMTDRTHRALANV